MEMLKKGFIKDWKPEYRTAIKKNKSIKTREIIDNIKR